ncbi:hypothetical protein HW555_007309, partial [Spodoptera exigua]
IGLGKILFQPVVLVDDELQSVPSEVVHFSGDRHKVHWTQVEAVEQTRVPAGHLEASRVVTEVAADFINEIDFKWIAMLKTALVIGTLETRKSACHVRHDGGQRLYLSHELVPYQCVVGVHVICEVSHMEDHIEMVALRLVLKMAARTGQSSPAGGVWNQNSSDHPYTEPAWYTAQQQAETITSAKKNSRLCLPYLVLNLRFFKVTVCMYWLRLSLPPSMNSLLEPVASLSIIPAPYWTRDSCVSLNVDHVTTMSLGFSERL